MPVNTVGYAATSETSPLTPFHYTVRDLKEDDVHIEVHYCGICHSDIHLVKNDWKLTMYPIVPGHEVTGIVKSVGSKVTKFKPGDRVGVGCMVGSCREAKCQGCKKGREMECPKMVQTYNWLDVDGSITKGGFGKDLVARESFVLRMPDSIPLDKGAPLLCAGITTYSPIHYYGFNKPSSRIGVVGLGGLGHVAVMILKAHGVQPVVISRSDKKKADAMKLGAADYIDSTDKQQMEANKNTLDGILDTVSAHKDVNSLLGLLKPDCTLCLVGAPPSDGKMIEIDPMVVLFGRKTFGGSLIGGIKETQEMLDFCAQHNILPWTEMISIDKVNEAFERITKADVRFRFVIDILKSKIPAQ